MLMEKDECAVCRATPPPLVHSQPSAYALSPAAPLFMHKGFGIPDSYLFRVNPVYLPSICSSVMSFTELVQPSLPTTHLIDIHKVILTSVSPLTPLRGVFSAFPSLPFTHPSPHCRAFTASLAPCLSLSGEHLGRSSSWRRHWCTTRGWSGP